MFRAAAVRSAQRLRRCRRASTTAATEFWNIRLPDVSYAPPALTAQIPYEPDFWASDKQPKVDVLPETALPKLLVVGGQSSSQGVATAGETHHLITGSPQDFVQITSLSDALAVDKPRGETGIIGDVLEDLGLLGVEFRLLPRSKQ